ncbi:unnamed protein product, partial [Polarella glacialis]
VGLAVARITVSSALSGAQSLQDAVTIQTRSGGVVIEELTDEGHPVTQSTASFSSTSRPLRPRKFMWPPLWTSLRSWLADPVQPNISPCVYSICTNLPGYRYLCQPVVQVALGTVTFPLWLGVGITSCCLLPWVLLADAVLQRLYVPRADRVEALAEGTLQMARGGGNGPLEDANPRHA